ncbi:phytanoyl-CoA dioxygenase family protein [Glycomyces xiaoerkulensis]|uniref:phytanoyl-CoA dioxygenase family protein n=1 Tax=Glycomyces xiaoerkulensis TaxID=2038139 RepID=UPI000C26697B|nr:phytanoyl-CoA dioxygenase family protein [Glycomyces xiaoerkulensis]
MTATATVGATALSPQQREAFERDGYLMIRGALDSDEVARYSAALDRVYAEEQDAGRLGPRDPMHKLSAVTSVPETADLLNHPNTFHYVWSMIGWNFHVYHSHVDVHPTVREKRPFRFEWHQDGGRQNREIETDPRPRLSVKLAYFFSDLSEPGRGNTKIVPGSHKWNRIDGPPRRDIEWPDPPGAIEVTGEAGDVLFFDRRIWHARSDNHSEITRRVAFFGFTPRWIRARDEVEDLPNRPWWNDLDPVQQQLLGGFAPTGDHGWGHYPDQTPVYRWLADRDLLDPDYPPLKP